MQQDLRNARLKASESSQDGIEVPGWRTEAQGSGPARGDVFSWGLLPTLKMAKRLKVAFDSHTGLGDPC